MSSIALVVHILVAALPSARAQGAEAADEPADEAAAPEGDDSFDLQLDPSLSASAPAEPIDRIVAVVGDRLVTSSDIQLEEVMAEHDPSPLSVVRARQEDPLEWLIDAAVIRGLASEVSIYQPTAVNVRERAERLRNGFATPDEYESFLRAFGLDQDTLEGILYTRLVVERYVARNLDLREASEAEGSPATRYAVWILERRSAVPIRLVDR